MNKQTAYFAYSESNYSTILAIVRIDKLFTLVIRKLQFDKTGGAGEMLCGLVLLFLVSLYEGNKMVLVLSLIVSNISGSEQCTEKFMELPLVEYRAQRIKMNLPENYMSGNTLRVLQEYEFNCSSTNITSLILGINIRTTTINSNSRTLFPSVQVFRPNGSIVNQYDLVTGSERTIYYSTSNVTTSGVYEYPLNPPISIRSGDLLAVSQPLQERSAVRVYYISNIRFHSSQQSIGSSNIDLSNSPTTNQLILIYPVTGKTHTHCIIELLYYH